MPLYLSLFRFLISAIVNMYALTDPFRFSFSLRYYAFALLFVRFARNERRFLFLHTRFFLRAEDRNHMYAMLGRSK